MFERFFIITKALFIQAGILSYIILYITQVPAWPHVRNSDHCGNLARTGSWILSPGHRSVFGPPDRTASVGTGYLYTLYRGRYRVVTNDRMAVEQRLGAGRSGRRQKQEKLAILKNTRKKPMGSYRVVRIGWIHAWSGRLKNHQKSVACEPKCEGWNHNYKTVVNCAK